MVDAVLEFFSALPRELYIFVISMLPIVELRGAVPVGAILDVPFYLNYLLSVIGNMLPVPFILLFIPKILTFLERFKLFKPIVSWLRGKADKHKSKVIVEEKANNESKENVEQADESCDTEVAGTAAACAGECDAPEAEHKRAMTPAIFIALMMFVALPIPTTGAWTGSLIASLFDLPFKKSFLAIFLGVLICGVIMTLASYGVLGFLSFLA